MLDAFALAVLRFYEAGRGHSMFCCDCIMCRVVS